jgi:hypothetical protein
MHTAVLLIVLGLKHPVTLPAVTMVVVATSLAHKVLKLWAIALTLAVSSVVAQAHLVRLVAAKVVPLAVVAPTVVKPLVARVLVPTVVEAPVVTLALVVITIMMVSVTWLVSKVAGTRVAW